jgi:hypothetical protein
MPAPQTQTCTANLGKVFPSVHRLKSQLQVPKALVQHLSVLETWRMHHLGPTAPGKKLTVLYAPEPPTIIP